MATKITSHVTIEEIVEAFLDSHSKLWVKPETTPGINLSEFIVRALRAQHSILCAQHLHDMMGRTYCAYCGYGITSDSSVGPMSGVYDLGVEI